MYVSPSHLSVSFLFCLKSPHSCFTSFYFRPWSSSVLSTYSCSFLHVSSNVSMFQKHVTLLCVFGSAGMSCHADFLSRTCLAPRCLPPPLPSHPACFYAFRSLQQLQTAAPSFTIYVQAMSRTFIGCGTKLKQQLYVAM